MLVAFRKSLHQWKFPRILISGGEFNVQRKQFVWLLPEQFLRQAFMIAEIVRPTRRCYDSPPLAWKKLAKMETRQEELFSHSLQVEAFYVVF